jgi:hypothetical protein
LREEAIPKLQWEVGINTAKARDKVVLEGTYCPFSGVAMVDVGWYQLIISVFLAHGHLNGIGSFVV